MSGLVAVLIGLAALLAERGIRAGHAARARTAVIGVPKAASRRRRHVPRDLVMVAGACAVVGAALFGVAGALAGVLGSIAARRLRERRRQSATLALLDEQLADAVRALAAALRAGMSVPQALAFAAEEASAPLGPTLSRLVAEIEVGRPLAAALAAWGDTVATDDARLVASALELHRRAGGDLPAVLEQVSDTIRERVEAAREVRALTAQARLSGLILGLLPIGFFAFLWVTSRRDMQSALTTPAGTVSVLLGLALEVGAFVWIRSLLAVEV